MVNLPDFQRVNTGGDYSLAKRGSWRGFGVIAGKQQPARHRQQAPRLRVDLRSVDNLARAFGHWVTFSRSDVTDVLVILVTLSLLIAFRVQAYVAVIARRAGRAAAIAAKRVWAAIRGEIGIVDGHPVVSPRALWVFYCASLVAVVQIPADGEADLTVLAVGIAGGLVAETYRRRRQKRWRDTGGRMGGAVLERVPDPTDALISQLKVSLPGAVPAIEAIAESMRANRAQVKENTARVDALEWGIGCADINRQRAIIIGRVDDLEEVTATAMQRIEALTAALAEAYRATGREVPADLAADTDTGPMLKVIPGGLSAG